MMSLDVVRALSYSIVMHTDTEHLRSAFAERFAVAPDAVSVSYDAETITVRVRNAAYECQIASDDDCYVFLDSTTSQPIFIDFPPEL